MTEPVLAVLGPASQRLSASHQRFVDGELKRQSDYYDALEEMDARGLLSWQAGKEPDWLKERKARAKAMRSRAMSEREIHGLAYATAAISAMAYVAAAKAIKEVRRNRG
jgi:hypothetical protein